MTVGTVAATAVLLQSYPRLTDDVNESTVRFWTILHSVLTVIIAVEWIMQLLVADSKVLYVFQFYPVCNLLSTVPYMVGWLVLLWTNNNNTAAAVLRGFQGARILLYCRLFMIVRVQKSWATIGVVLRKRKTPYLWGVRDCGLVETPFISIPDTLYWSVTSLFTIGDGQMIPVTGRGKAVAAVLITFGMLFAFLPIFVVASSIWRSIAALTTVKAANKTNIVHLVDPHASPHLQVVRQLRNRMDNCIALAGRLQPDLKIAMPKMGRHVGSFVELFADAAKRTSDDDLLKRIRHMKVADLFTRMNSPIVVSGEGGGLEQQTQDEPEMIYAEVTQKRKRSVWLTPPNKRKQTRAKEKLQHAPGPGGVPPTLIFSYSSSNSNQTPSSSSRSHDVDEARLDFLVVAAQARSHTHHNHFAEPLAADHHHQQQQHNSSDRTSSSSVGRGLLLLPAAEYHNYSDHSEEYSDDGCIHNKHSRFCPLAPLPANNNNPKFFTNRVGGGHGCSGCSERHFLDDDDYNPVGCWGISPPYPSSPLPPPPPTTVADEESLLLPQQQEHPMMGQHDPNYEEEAESRAEERHNKQQEPECEHGGSDGADVGSVGWSDIFLIGLGGGPPPGSPVGTTATSISEPDPHCSNFYTNTYNHNKDSHRSIQSSSSSCHSPSSASSCSNSNLEHHDGGQIELCNEVPPPLPPAAGGKTVRFGMPLLDESTGSQHHRNHMQQSAAVPHCLPRWHHYHHDHDQQHHNDSGKEQQQQRRRVSLGTVGFGAIFSLRGSSHSTGDDKPEKVVTPKQHHELPLDNKQQCNKSPTVPATTSGNTTVLPYYHATSLSPPSPISSSPTDNSLGNNNTVVIPLSPTSISDSSTTGIASMNGDMVQPATAKAASSIDSSTNTTNSLQCEQTAVRQAVVQVTRPEAQKALHTRHLLGHSTNKANKKLPQAAT
eukprot:TRINITY_DN62703_c0_g1_i2.p1 TRINITY_DN62703_c0_g1~~TRINITY_DN62703_c0_g1_i2.p1  ORF type:complete len:938 (-),score=142.00 TRINITY_DN62703_c0_g1_i2:125-2938(-)